MSGFELFSFDPPRQLAPFVEAIWGVRGTAGYTTEAVLPSGAVELMINFGPEQRVVGHGERTLADTYRHAWLAGIQDRRLVHASEHGADHISARFRPGGAHAFFDLPMDETRNRVVELDLLVGREATSLRDRLGALASDRARATELAAWLGERRRVRSCFETVRRAAELLRDEGAFRTSVAEVCSHLGLSNKHLVQQFHQVVGVPPKVLGRIERFQAAIAACRGGAPVSWSQVAHELGYADQSHMIREFKRLGSVTPSEFLVRRSADSAAVIIE